MQGPRAEEAVVGSCSAAKTRIFNTLRDVRPMSRHGLRYTAQGRDTVLSRR